MAPASLVNRPAANLMVARTSAIPAAGIIAGLSYLLLHLIGLAG